MGSGVRTTLLGGISAWSRRLPESRWKTRLGRVVGAVLPKVGASPVVVVRTERGAFVVDARSRTECEMLWSGVYDEDDVDFLLAASPVDGVFLDVGANVGLIFIPVWRALTSGQAIAVEPVAVNFERLSAACAANRPTTREPILLNLALGAEPGTLTIVKEGPAGTSDNATVALPGQIGLQVRVETLDGTCESLGLHRLDTIKIDVEGYEYEVFAGGRDAIERFRPIVYGEFNNRLMPLRGTSFRDVWDVFGPLGYRCFSFAGRLLLDEKPDPPADLGNVVLVPEEKLSWLLGRGVQVRQRH